MGPTIRYAYLHGFASSAESFKGTEMARTFEQHGIGLERLNLNQPSFSALTYSGALGVVDNLVQQHDPNIQWRLIGSSMGGYLAARWAMLHPERIDRLMLLCPGFDLLSRWPVLLGEKSMELWERWGEIRVTGPTGEMVPLHWAFIEDARTHPAVPEVPCPTLIIHGEHDTIVPIESSRSYTTQYALARLIEVDSDHGLVSAMPDITAQALEFFNIA